MTGGNLHKTGGKLAATGVRMHLPPHLLSEIHQTKDVKVGVATTKGGVATAQGEPVSPEGTLEGNKDYLPPSSHSHHPAPRKLRLQKMQDSGPDSGRCLSEKGLQRAQTLASPQRKVLNSLRYLVFCYLQ